jgi:glycerol-3-phosphate O-acyltransferase
MGEIISLDRQQSVLMTYYRNNIIHVLALPSLVAHMAVLKEGLTKAEITQAMTKLYPFLKKELFIRYETSEIDDVVEDILNSMQAMSLIDIKDDKILHNAANIQTLILLSRTISETLQRYAIAFAVLDAHPLLEMSEIESRSQDVAQRLGRLHGINAPEFFDKGVFAFLSNTLVEEEYFDREKGGDRERIHQLSTQLMQMLTAEVRLTILESID